MALMILTILMISFLSEGLGWPLVPPDVWPLLPLEVRLVVPED
jgi:hypothetical protein